MNSQSRNDFYWSLPQPLFVFGCTLLVASAITTGWMDVPLLVGILIWMPIPLLLIAERFAPRRADWLLNWRDVAEDAFWVFATYLIWVPIFDEYYDTPISNAFAALREASAFPFRLEADSITGLLACAMVGIVAVEFIGYWAHRVQHRFLFFWRMHATHHHITKMSVARADRTHPLEFIGLNLGSAVALAYLGASADVVAVVVVFRVTTAHVNHSNLPLTSGVFGSVFNTAQWHQLHHSLVYEESNTNYGCTVILWDRIFGTFSNKTSIEAVGNGTGKQLSLITQLTMPFRTNAALRGL